MSVLHEHLGMDRGMDRDMDTDMDIDMVMDMDMDMNMDMNMDKDADTDIGNDMDIHVHCKADEPTLSEDFKNRESTKRLLAVKIVHLSDETTLLLLKILLK
jgi:hypothetical protein